MELNIIDYYNDYPKIISVIDKLNEEANLLKKNSCFWDFINKK